MSHVLFVDTSVLLNILDVPGKNSDRASILDEFKKSALGGVLMVIPIAAVVEVGNHIAQLTDGGVRRDRASKFAAFLREAINEKRPWVISGATWDTTFLARLIEGHGHVARMADLCMSRIGTGDASILLELHHYRSRTDLPSGRTVSLWTLDASLAAYA